MEKAKKHTMYSRLEKKRFPFIYLCILLPVVHFIVFFIYVNFNSILLAFQTPNGVFTMENFKDVFKAITDADHYGFSVGRALKHSVTLWVWLKVIIFPVSIISTYMLFKRVPGHYFFRTVFMIPSLIGSVIWVSVLTAVVDYNGPIVALCNALNITLPENVIFSGFLNDASTAFSTMLVFTVVAVVGGDVVLTGAFSRIPTEIFESARLDGVGFWRECVQIAVPCVAPTLSTILTFALCSFFVQDCNAYLYTGGLGQPEAETMGFYFLFLRENIATDAVGKSLYNYPAAVGVVITAFTVPFVLLGRWGLDKVFEPVEF